MPAHSIACRRAVHQALLRPNQHVWISEEAVSDAFLRFVRLSRTGTKRYGSHVPGPLEAQRRLAKRRMMGLAAAGNPVAPDFGALFGFSRPTNPMWTYEAPFSTQDPPPSLQSFAQPLAPSYLPFLEHEQPEPVPDHRETPFSDFLRRLDGVPINPPRQVLKTIRSWIKEIPEDLVHPARLSRITFERLVQRNASLELLFKYLTNRTLNHPEARNMTIMVNHCLQKPLDKDAWKLLVTEFNRAIGFGGLTHSDLSHIVQNASELASKCFSHSEKSAPLMEFYRMVWAAASASMNTPGSALDAEILHRIITDMKLFASAGIGPDFGVDSPPRSDTGCSAYFLDTIIEMIEQLPIEPEMVETEHLRAILAVFPATRLRYWLPRITVGIIDRNCPVLHGTSQAAPLFSWFELLKQTSHSRPAREWLDLIEFITNDTILSTPRKNLLEFKTLKEWDICRIFITLSVPCSLTNQDTLPQDLKRLQSISKHLQDNPKAYGDEAISGSVYASFITKLADNDLPYKATLDRIINLVRHLHGTAAAIFLMEIIKRKRPLRFNSKSVKNLLNDYITNNPGMEASLLKIAQFFPTEYPLLPVALMRRREIALPTIFRHLVAPAPSFKVPIRHRSNPLNPLSPQRSSQLQRIAYEVAQNERRGTSVCYRYVYATYRFLRDRQAPLDPTLAHAFVMSGIIRPLRDLRFVSAARYNFIRRLVEQLEGEEEALRLDTLVWRWRGQVFETWRQRWKKEGFPGQVHVATARSALRNIYPSEQFPLRPNKGDGYIRKVVLCKHTQKLVPRRVSVWHAHLVKRSSKGMSQRLSQS